MEIVQEVLRPAFQRRLDAYIEEQYVPEGTQKEKAKIVKGGLPPIVGAALAWHFTTKDIRELLEEKEDTFSERLLALIRGKHLRASDVYRKAGLTKALFSKIRHDVDYKPSKDTVLCIIFALELTEDEADDLLRRAGYSFSPSQVRDIIIQYFVKEGILDIDAVDEVLFDRHLKTLHKDE